MVRVHVQRTIAAAPDRVFDWLADPANLAAAPLILRGSWADGFPPQVGAVRKVSGIGMWFREEITAYDPPRSYSYLIVGSFPPFDHEGGTVAISPTGDGARVDWETSFTHPWRVGGGVLAAVSRPLLHSNFVAILAGCAKALEPPHHPGEHVQPRDGQR